ncbi:unnamed protein product [Microthlaspi erraticum]|uniref:Uncharacterized protein n=1 Tax=Microthlaspi erraticum TaxID=1685480 RepID=A0A6D2JIW5_9BRAS|nr:unnamed protein product [Microthlaspi erraticum]
MTLKEEEEEGDDRKQCRRRKTDHLLLPASVTARNRQTILKLLLQISIYVLWRERNARIFTASTTPPAIMKRQVDRLMRDRLISFPVTDSAPSLLEFYFSIISPI